MNVLVIGAGVVGCAIAHELAARGVRVRVVDMRHVGHGATRASAGVLCPHIEGHAADLLRLGTLSLGMYDTFIERVRADSGQPIEYRRSGTLEVALTDEDAAALRAQAERHRALGIEHRYLDAVETRALEPALTERVAGALLVPVHGYVRVADLTSALAAGARARGAQIEQGTALDRITVGSEGLRVTARDATIDVDTVVIAAGSWSGRVVVDGAAAAPVRPIRGQLLRLAGRVRAGRHPFASHVIWAPGCYMVPWQDGSLLVGATMEDVGFDEGATVAGIRDLLDAACDVLPSLWTARFEEVRVGLRPATQDAMPIIGRSSVIPGVVYATGHYRNGVLLAPLTAALVADLVLDGREAPELELTSPRRFGL